MTTRKKISFDDQQLKDTVSYLPSAAARHHGIRRPLRLVLPLCNAAHAAAVTLKSSMYCRVGRNVEEKGVSAAAALRLRYVLAHYTAALALITSSTVQNLSEQCKKKSTQSS